ncbi:MAG: anti-sigma factor antagonist [Gaiellaceae bacterium]|nr:anti-sigma factor antagonist [Gaiellaceae bacterium]
MSRAPARDLNITLAEIRNDVFVATAAGELDLARKEELERALEAVLARGRARLVLDASGVPLIDSSALGLLTGAARRLRAAGGDLLLVSDDPRVRRTLEVTGLDRFFLVAPSLTAALESL